MFTRLGYFVIVAILAAAGVAIAFVLWSAVGPSGGKSATTAPATATAANAASVTVSPAVSQPTIPFSRVIDFARAGAVLRIDAQNADVTVVFRDDFDTSGFNTTSHVFRSSVEQGQDVVQVLEDAGVAVNRAGGVTVNKR
jgi:hypothetical protein